MTGAGSAGKSLATLQLAICIALGITFLGEPTRQATALFISCEDDADELHRRIKSICDALGIPLTALSGKLYLVSLVGHVGSELANFDASGRMHVTPAHGSLKATIEAIGAGLVILDNVAHLFAGNENIRNQVAAFVGLLNAIAANTSAAIILIGHPNKGGDSFSGSTAWQNQVRMHLYLSLKVEADGTVRDPDVRILSRAKSNYARNGEAISFRWHRGAFVAEGDLPSELGAQITANLIAGQEDETFLKCLSERNRQGRPVSERFSRSYAPTVFSAMPEGKAISKAGHERAMDRLFRAGRIERAVLGRDKAKGRDIEGLREVADTNHQRSPKLFPNPSPNGPHTYPEPHPNPTPDTPLYTTYREGGAIEGPPPSRQDKGGQL